jgi:RNA polymerase sigma-70 factor (ECF subfamily)
MKTDRAYLNTLWQNVAANGDQRSFEELFHHCYQRLVRFSVEYVQSHESAEEIVSDMFLKLWAGRESYLDVQNIETYLFTAIRNRSLNFLRKFSALRVVSTDNPEQFAITRSHDPYKASEWKELLARLDEAVEMLPPKRRKIFRLVREEGFRPREVAEIMNISPRTVETQLFKAVKTLHAVLRPHLPVRQKAVSTAAGEAFLLSLLLVFSSF